MDNTIKKIPVFMLICALFVLAACASPDEKVTSESVDNSLSDSLLEEAYEQDGDEMSSEAADDKTAADDDSTSLENANADNTENIPRPSSSGALTLSGTELIDEKGDSIQLKGISTHGVAWFPEYINQDCFSDISEFFGANVIRLAMYTEESGGYCTDGDREYLRELIKNGVEYAANADMYVIVDWHILSDGDPNTNESFAEEFFAWASAQFAERNNVLYEICNEPNEGTSWAEIRSYAEKIIPLIRANDEDAIIIVGTPNWSQYVNEAAADPIEGYDNIMYTLHFYAATHKDDLRNTLKSAVEAGLPVFVTEYGICDASGSGVIDTEEADKWVSLMDELGVSYCAWNLSNKDESSAIIRSGCDKTSGFEYDDLSESGKWLYGTLSADPSAASTGFVSGAEEETGSDALNDGEVDENGSSGSSGSISWSAKLSNSWESDGHDVYMYIFTVTNIGDEEVTSWNVTVLFDGNINVTDAWNGEFSENGSALVIKNASYNGTLSPGDSASDIGVILFGGKIKEQ